MCTQFCATLLECFIYHIKYEKCVNSGSELHQTWLHPAAGWVRTTSKWNIYSPLLLNFQQKQQHNGQYIQYVWKTWVDMLKTATPPCVRWKNNSNPVIGENAVTNPQTLPAMLTTSSPTRVEVSVLKSINPPLSIPVLDKHATNRSIIKWKTTQKKFTIEDGECG